ncbi:MAG: ATP-binding protein, partial [Marinobacter sp.]
ENAINWAESCVKLAGVIEGGWLVLSVSDDGPGMSPDTRQEALSRGGRLDESRSGSGLGLAIVTELALLHGGELRLDNSPEGGLRAEVVLPMTQLRSRL